MGDDSYLIIGELVINKYGDIGMIIEYNHLFNTYKVEWYGGSTPYTVEHQEHKIKEYLSNYDLYEKTKIYHR